jgi:hypothetical protein
MNNPCATEPLTLPNLPANIMADFNKNVWPVAGPVLAIQDAESPTATFNYEREHLTFGVIVKRLAISFVAVSIPVSAFILGLNLIVQNS